MFHLVLVVTVKEAISDRLPGCAVSSRVYFRADETSHEDTNSWSESSVSFKSFENESRQKQNKIVYCDQIQSNYRVIMLINIKPEIEIFYLLSPISALSTRCMKVENCRTFLQLLLFCRPSPICRMPLIAVKTRHVSSRFRLAFELHIIFFIYLLLSG